MITASFEVESFFTNIPLLETIDLSVQKLFEGKDYIDGLSQDSFLEMLTITMTESFILFDNKYYSQPDGVAVGSPLGPTLANIFLCVYKILWLEKCPTELRSVIYKRYVDNISALSKYQSNWKNSNVTLTSNMLILSLPLKLRWIIRSFLDIKILRENYRFTTSVYHKPTFSGVFTKFESFIPNLYKYTLLFTLLHRPFKLCSIF